MRNYYRVMLGKKSVFAEECFAGNFIGADFGIAEDLSEKLPDEWRAFNKRFIPIFLAGRSDKTKIGAGLACGALWTVAKGIKREDIVLCPDGTGTYRVGEVVGEYQYAPGHVLPHRRPVQWSRQSIDRSEMSPSLKHSAGAIGTISDVSSYRKEIEKLIGEGSTSTIVSLDPAVEDPVAFCIGRAPGRLSCPELGADRVGEAARHL